MSDQDNRDEQRPATHPPRSRFQQPGGKPINASTSPRADRSGEPIDAPSAPESEQSAESVPRPFPPTVTLYADHPLTLIDRLQSLYDHAELDQPYPKRWSLGVTLTLADADVWDQVQAATLESLHSLLPIALHVTQVEATIHDRQEYRATWTIDPNTLDEVRRARASVIASIQSLVPTLALLPLEPAISVAESVPALNYPSLIAAMQRDFSPFAWSIDSLQFVPVNE